MNEEQINRGFSPEELVRIHEGNCKIDFPNVDEQNFRIAIMKHIARKLGLAELKGSTFTGSGTGVTRPTKQEPR